MVTDNYIKQVQKLSSVLNIIDITTFFHIRVTHENKFFILSSNLNLATYLIKNKNIGDFFTGLIQTAVCGKISATLWPDDNNDHFLKTLQELGICNGISIALPFSNYIDIFSFAANQKNTQIKNFYLNHIRLLKGFIIYFRLKGRKIIEHANKNITSKINHLIQFNQNKNQKEIIAAILQLPSVPATVRQKCVRN